MKKKTIFGLVLLFGFLTPNCFSSGNAEQDAAFFGAVLNAVGEAVESNKSNSSSGNSSYGSDEYIIYSGTYTRSDGVTQQGFSGTGQYMNDPSAVDRENEGPIPNGVYTLKYIGYSPKLGPDVIECVPSGNNTMYGRKGFYIHGGTKSEGCIIINDPAFRCSLAGHTLIVR